MNATTKTGFGIYQPGCRFLKRNGAVAVVQQLIAAVASGSDELTPPFDHRHSITSRLARMARWCVRIAGLRQPFPKSARYSTGMLPRSTAVVRVPGGFDHTIARALNEVDASPFDSVAERSPRRPGSLRARKRATCCARHQTTSSV